MTPADYRKMAADLLRKAAEARDKPIAIQLEALAQAYIRLAEQAEQNSRQDLWIEVVPKPPRKGKKVLKNSAERDRMRRKVDDFVSLFLALCVTVVFIVVTIARWPEPLRVQKYQLERDNPFAAIIHRDQKVAAVRLANN